MHVPNIKFFSSLTSFYLLKLTKFLVKIFQFEFLVMIKKNIFVYKPFLLLNISDLSLFFFKKKLQPLPPWKRLLPSFPATPLFSSNPLSKLRSCQTPPPLFENLVGGSTFPSRMGWGYKLCFSLKRLFERSNSTMEILEGAVFCIPFWTILFIIYVLIPGFKPCDCDCSAWQWCSISIRVTLIFTLTFLND